MTAIICTLIICAAVVACYWMYLNRPLQVEAKDEAEAEDTKRGGPYRAHWPMPESLPPIGSVPPGATVYEDDEELEQDEDVLPKLAREYLEAAEKLEMEGAKEDMQGFPGLGDNRRDAAAVCRQKAEKLIEEANSE